MHLFKNYVFNTPVGSKTVTDYLKTGARWAGFGVSFFTQEAVGLVSYSFAYMHSLTKKLTTSLDPRSKKSGRPDNDGVDGTIDGSSEDLEVPLARDVDSSTEEPDLSGDRDPEDATPLSADSKEEVTESDNKIDEAIDQLADAFMSDKGTETMVDEAIDEVLAEETSKKKK